MRIGSSSRVPATTDFLREVASQPNGDEHIKRLILKVCDPREYLSEPEKAAAVREHLNRVLEPDGLAIAVVGGKAHLTERLASGAIIDPFISKVAILDFDTVQTENRPCSGQPQGRPEDAACFLIVCRPVLIELRLPLPAKKDIDGLLRAVQEPLAWTWRGRCGRSCPAQSIRSQPSSAPCPWPCPATERLVLAWDFGESRRCTAALLCQLEIANAGAGADGATLRDGKRSAERVRDGHLLAYLLVYAFAVSNPKCNRAA